MTYLRPPPTQNQEIKQHLTSRTQLEAAIKSTIIKHCFKLAYFTNCQRFKCHAVKSKTFVMQLMQLHTYCGQLQVTLWFCGRRALCLRNKCGRRKTWSGHKQDQGEAGEQHDMHFTEFTLHEL